MPDEQIAKYIADRLEPGLMVTKSVPKSPYTKATMRQITAMVILSVPDDMLDDDIAHDLADRFDFKPQPNDVQIVCVKIESPLVGTNLE